ncbi:MAG: type II toxin-antitoxin system PemK/MazF family toxin [Armatimonadetes bacterium]|nr:type II toxin-antitoxin system PemK/MazF family toxin [Armatimonadota bacterium]
MSPVRRGEVYFVDLDPVVGSEQGGRRPCVIIQNDVSNQNSPVLIVSMITARPPNRDRPTDVHVGSEESGLSASSRVLLNQIRMIDRSRLGRYVGRLTDDELLAVDEALRISLGLVPL